MKRRTFLHHLSISPIIGSKILGGAGLLSIAKSALAANDKTLIVIFQRGGCDGLNTVIPYGEDSYYSLRPTISIEPPGSNSKSALDLDGFFGFHPSLASLHNIYQDGNLAVLPTVHYPDGNRSHFSSQDFIESGSAHKRLSDGWLNRYLTNTNTNSLLPATSFGELSHALQGKFPVGVMPNLDNLQSNLNEEIIQSLYSVFGQNNPDRSSYLQLLNKHGSIMIDEVELLSNSNYENYTPSNGASYPSSSFGNQLRQTAHLIKSGLGLEVCTINHTGWDHHINQGGANGKQANKLKDFSDGIAALYNDLGRNHMENIIILTMTEFGRTAKENANSGTDHGNASSWFAIGGSVNGGIYGEWPGLQPNDLYLGRYLKHTTDYRDIFSEIIVNHFGNQIDLTSIIPSHAYQPLGFL